MNLIEELRWRGMIQDMMPGTEEQLLKEPTAGYVGFDPTADSLHIGSLVPILLLVHLQRAGHKPYALVGGATGMVGDPSHKSEERKLLGEEELNKNVEGIKKQLSRFLNFDEDSANSAELVNNYSWFKELSFLNFIRDVGKHITVNYMMAKDSVKKRMEGDVGISFTEFSYQLIQGFDFYYLYKNHGCKLQMGGSDQWGNITTGSELIRRMAKEEAFAFTCPLIKKADGGKFGKTEQGNVWLDANRTTPYEFYQFWLNASDEDAKSWIKIFTFLTRDDIDGFITEHNNDPSLRILQKKLATEITRFVHGEEALTSAIETTEKLFSAQKAPIDALSAADLESMEGIVKIRCPRESLSNTDVVSFTAEHHIFNSKGEARKMIANGGLSVNRIKVTDAALQMSSATLLHNSYLLIQKGKKQYYLVIAE